MENKKKYYLAPGQILVNEFLKKKFLNKDKTEIFLDVGCGIGLVSNVLLELGFRGVGIDLNKDALSLNKTEINKNYFKNNYDLINNSFMKENFENKFNFIISCMVIEHLDEIQLKEFFDKAKKSLIDGGEMYILVPGSMKHWGVEDEIAGHKTRYDYIQIQELSNKFSLNLIDYSGLTYPLSNILKPLSDYIVKKHETKKNTFSKNDDYKTIASSIRGTNFKTEYPYFMRYFINKFTLAPFIFLQKIFNKNKNSMIIYSKFKFK
jgi:cyclopropane fatty-acyl-phospholipid synthase-like methyltransferase